MDTEGPTITNGNQIVVANGEIGKGSIMRSFTRKQDGLRMLGLCAVVLLACVVCTAEEAAEDAEETRVLTPLEQRMQKPVSVDFREMPIDDVVRIMAAQADVDVVKSPAVMGNVTATLTDVPLEEALRNILAAHGYGYVADRNMLRIAPHSELMQAAESMVHKIYQVTYADVLEVEKALNKFKSQRGIVSANPGTSHIIVNDTESHVKAIDTFIAEIDQVTPQILVEARIYDITCQENFDLGVQWQAGRNTVYPTDVTAPGGVSWPPGATTVDHASTAAGIADQHAMNPLLDTEPFATGAFAGATAKTEDTTGILRMGVLNSYVDIDMLISAQQESISAKLLANPRILVLDNQEAIFDIVREIPYKETTAAGGGLQTETIKFRDVGVKLVVTPHVARDGMLRLNVVPEFGVIVGTDPATNVPTVDTRRVNTIALVKDGQTVVLGGLRKKDVSQQINKVPVLGDLPVLGRLFRFEGEATATTELVVFITPRVIAQPIAMSQLEKETYEETEFAGPTIRYTRAEKQEESEE